MNLRLLALGGVAMCVVALPLAVASAGPVGDEGSVADRERPLAADTVGGAKAGGAVRPKAGSATHATAESADGAADRLRTDTARDVGEGTAADATDSTADTPLLALGPVTAARCGPELTSPEGIEAQTCVLTQGEDTWARTYFRNATGGALDSVLSLMGPGERTVQMHCLAGAEDEPGTCETPRERTRGPLDAYTAVAEFAGVSAREGEGPLLLRSGSNSEARTAS